MTLIASQGRLTLQWTENANNEPGFRIERWSNGGSFTQIAEVGADVRSLVNED